MESGSDDRADRHAFDTHRGREDDDPENDRCVIGDRCECGQGEEILRLEDALAAMPSPIKSGESRRMRIVRIASGITSGGRSGAITCLISGSARAKASTQSTIVATVASSITAEEIARRLRSRPSQESAEDGNERRPKGNGHHPEKDEVGDPKSRIVGIQLGADAEIGDPAGCRGGSPAAG